MGMNAAFNRYQPALQSLPNPLSNGSGMGPGMGGVQAPAGAKDTAKVPGIQAAMAKRGSDNILDFWAKRSSQGQLKQSFDFSSMANDAIQSSTGQGILSAGAGLYNSLPSQMRDGIGAKAMEMGGLNDQNATNWQMPGYTQDPSQGVGVKGNTTVRNDELTKDRTMTMTPGHAGSPISQLLRGAMTGQMPKRTFPQGTPVANKLVVNQDQISQDKLVPQKQYDRKFGMGKAGSQDNGAQRLSSAGESSGVKFKHDNDGHATGSSAFDTLDGYMKKAGLNSFQTQFFGRLIQSGVSEHMAQAAIKSAGAQFGEKVAAELEDGMAKLAQGGRLRAAWNVAKGVGGYFGKKLFPEAAEQIAKGTNRIGQKAVQEGTKSTLGKATKQLGKGKLKPGTESAVDRLRQSSRAAGETTKRKATTALKDPKTMQSMANQGTARNALNTRGLYEGAKQTGKEGLKGLWGITKSQARGPYGERAITGGLHSAFNPHSGVLYDEDRLAPGGMYRDKDGNIRWGRMTANILGNMALTGGKGGRQMMHRANVGEGGGFGIGMGAELSGLAPEGTAQRLADFGYYGGAASQAAPGTGSLRDIGRAIPGLKNRIGQAVPKTIPSPKPGPWKPTTNPDWEKLPWWNRAGRKVVDTPLFGPEYGKGFKPNSMAEAVDPVGWGIKGVVGTARAAKNKAMKLLPDTVKKHPVASGVLATGGISGTAGTAYLGNKAINAVDEATRAGERANELMSNPNELIDNYVKSEQGQEQLREFAGSQAGNIFSDLLNDLGGNVYAAIESMFGPETADFLNKHKWKFLAGAVGLGGGYALGGKEGAVLGGIGLPLAMMLAQSGSSEQTEEDQSGAGADAALTGGAQEQPVVTPGSEGAEGGAALRSEQEANTATEDLIEPPQASTSQPFNDPNSPSYIPSGEGTAAGPPTPQVQSEVPQVQPEVPPVQPEVPPEAAEGAPAPQAQANPAAVQEVVGLLNNPFATEGAVGSKLEQQLQEANSPAALQGLMELGDAVLSSGEVPEKLIPILQQYRQKASQKLQSLQTQ
jgi:hypothetical protein